MYSSEASKRDLPSREGESARLYGCVTVLSRSADQQASAAETARSDLRTPQAVNTASWTGTGSSAAAKWSKCLTVASSTATFRGHGLERRPPDRSDAHRSTVQPPFPANLQGF